MAPQRYERVSGNDHDTDSRIEDSALSPSSSSQPQQHQPSHAIPSSPPPSFRSRASSIALNRSSTEHEHDPLFADPDRTLADTFDAPSDDDSDGEEANGLDDRQRVMSGRPSGGSTNDGASSPRPDGRPAVERRVTQLPAFPPSTSTRTYGGGNAVHDGVFANLSAKTAPGEEGEEKPPSYEQAAADATPPYWENTILAPGGTASDEVYIDGLPVGSLFSFIWNGMISMSFQLVGFLLTYLLHTTHAAKNGSKAGLGITLVQYGFSMKGASSNRPHIPNGDDGAAGDGAGGRGTMVSPNFDPDSHDFDPNASFSSGVSIAGNAIVPNVTEGADAARGSAHGGGLGAVHASDWFAYGLMIVGWFVLIRAISEYLKARRHEALVLQSPSRGLNVAVVAEGEDSERSV